MEDLSKEMDTGKRVSPKMRRLLDKEKSDARKRVIARGIVHFRADEEFMIALLDVSDHLKMAPGTLCRRIIWEQLKTINREKHSKPSDAKPVIENTEKLMNKLEIIQELLSSAITTQSSAPATNLQIDVSALAFDLKRGQEEIRKELSEIHAQLLNSAFRSEKQ